jgi:hypothetical protein
LRDGRTAGRRFRIGVHRFSVLLTKSAFQNEFANGLRKFQQIMEQAMVRKAS